ncbi:MAG: MCP four helix bundle domain-containing protein [Deltaproteobacteria bacterium]|nr:MCP four helix bundle domain-containing protein [Deltaproteobacteria bacterium]
MSNRINLRKRIGVILSALIFITLMGGVVMIWYTYQMDGILSIIVDKNVAALQAAEALETALANQKGFVSYYFLDGNPKWLEQLEEYRQIFKYRLQIARKLIKTDHQKRILDDISSEYSAYINDKDRVIEYYRNGERITVSELHISVRNRFFKILALCEDFKKMVLHSFPWVIQHIVV